MQCKWFKVTVTFIEPVLGTQSTKDIATRFINKQFIEDTGQMPADELQTLPEALEQGTTVFHKLDGKPIFFNYMMKGFLKEAGGNFNKKIDSVANLRSKVNNYVFVYPRRIPINVQDEMTINERPLRGMTQQGPRTSLARSEQLQEGTWFECYLKVYPSEISEALLRELLSYGQDQGIGQWRNASWGSFVYTMEALESEPPELSN